MPYRLMADLVLVAHLAFVLFAVLGGLLVLRWKRVVWVHVPAAAWAAFVELSGRICPLTPLEHSLRVAAGSQAYQGDFIGYYLLPILYPAGLTPLIQIGLGLAIILINIAVYLTAWHRRS
jgi:hypothetical protein